MGDNTVRTIEAQGPGSVLEEIARQGAQRMLAQAMEADVAEFLARHGERRDDNGHQLVVRNGHMPERDLMTGIGAVRIKRPRVDDRGLTRRARSEHLEAVEGRRAGGDRDGKDRVRTTSCRTWASRR